MQPSIHSQRRNIQLNLADATHSAPIYANTADRPSNYFQANRCCGHSQLHTGTNKLATNSTTIKP